MPVRRPYEKTHILRMRFLDARLLMHNIVDADGYHTPNAWAKKIADSPT
jgi:hypothetical protein